MAAAMAVVMFARYGTRQPLHPVGRLMMARGRVMIAEEAPIQQADAEM